MNMEKIVGINQMAKEYVYIVIKEYVYIVIDGKRIPEHRYVWEKHNGIKPKGMFIHHKDGNKKNNNIENLQLVSRKEHGKLHRKT